VQQCNELCINTIRTLSMDAVQRANSGHPGTPMALAPLSHLLWTKYIQYTPRNLKWWNRDRFVLSCGHASMLLYAQYHLSGFPISIDDIKNFRQWGSITPGHPEYHDTPGAETTTGPLGQGFANAVGMAIAEEHLSAKFNREGFNVVDHSTYVIASDGDLMEGVCAEAASLAGHLGLGKLVVYYDDNNITIDGTTDLSFTENVGERFKAYGWHVQTVKDINDFAELAKVTDNARAESAKPSLVIVKSHIGFGSPNKQDTSAAHGSPLGADEIELTKKTYAWEHSTFFVPEEVKTYYTSIANEAKKNAEKWDALFADYGEKYPELAAEFSRVMQGINPKDWEKEFPSFEHSEAMASRQSSGKVMQAIAKCFPEFIGGSADLACSNSTYLKECGDFSKTNRAGRNLHFGIREHAMASIANGMALHGGVLPFTATFFVFTDYMRPAMRLAALMKLPVRYVLTHDSIGLGEDGPTHQPVEHLMSLRAMPGLSLLRPGDANETLGAWKYSMENKQGPVALVLSRQNLTPVPGSCAEKTACGAYVVKDFLPEPKLILIASGSELSLAFEAAEELAAKGVAVRLVSMPSWELFEEQSEKYKESVFPARITARLAVEAGCTFGWQRYVGEKGCAIGIDHFGASAPAPILFEQFGFTKKNIIEKAQALLEHVGN